MTQEQFNNEGDSAPPVVAVTSDGSSSSDEEFPSNVSFGSQVMDRTDLKMTDVIVEQDQERSIMMGAGILTGLLGCVMCGPMVGCLVGTGAAIGTYRPTPAGSVARSLGYCAVSAATCSRRKAEALDQQHQFSTKVQETEIFQKSAALYETKAKPAAEWTWGGIKVANENYRIVDRSWAGVEYALDNVHKVVIGEKPTKGNKNNPKADDTTSSSGTDFSIGDDEYDETAVGQEMKKGRTANGYATVNPIAA
eukprot:scaffold2590_cov160-Amphora_coffeaeformis.AAC.4